MPLECRIVRAVGRSPMWLSLVLAALIGMAGCGDRAAARIGAFDAATQELERGVAESFDAAEHANEQAFMSRSLRDVQRALAKPSATDAEKNQRSDAVKQAIGDFDPAKCQPLLSREDLSARTELLEGLSKYADLLSQTMGNEPLDQVDQKTQDLAAALEQLGNNDLLKARFPKVAKELRPGETMAIFATAVSTLGRWIIDGYRHKTVPEAIKQMKPDIDKICDLLIRDIGNAPKPDGTGASGLRGIVWNKYTDAVNDYKQWVEAASKGPQALTPLEMRDELGRIQTMWNSYRDVDRGLAATANAIRAMKAAHDKLDDAFSDSAFHVDVLIDNLRKEVFRIRDYYKKSLNNS